MDLPGWQVWIRSCLFFGVGGSLIWRLHQPSLRAALVKALWQQLRTVAPQYERGWSKSARRPSSSGKVRCYTEFADSICYLITSNSPTDDEENGFWHWFTNRFPLPRRFSVASLPRVFVQLQAVTNESRHQPPAHRNLVDRSAPQPVIIIELASILRYTDAVILTDDLRCGRSATVGASPLGTATPAAIVASCCRVKPRLLIDAFSAVNDVDTTTAEFTSMHRHMINLTVGFYPQTPHLHGPH